MCSSDLKKERVVAALLTTTTTTIMSLQGSTRPCDATASSASSRSSRLTLPSCTASSVGIPIDLINQSVSRSVRPARSHLHQAIILSLSLSLTHTFFLPQHKNVLFVCKVPRCMTTHCRWSSKRNDYHRHLDTRARYCAC